MLTLTYMMVLLCVGRDPDSDWCTPAFCHARLRPSLIAQPHQHRPICFRDDPASGHPTTSQNDADSGPMNAESLGQLVHRLTRLVGRNKVAQPRPRKQLRGVARNTQAVLRELWTKEMSVLPVYVSSLVSITFEFLDQVPQ